MSKWGDEHHFVSWLRLCPDNRISGNKVWGKGRLPTNNRASIALKMAASTLRLSNTYLGAQFRRFRTKLGAPVAIKAMAAKLARFTACSATGWLHIGSPQAGPEVAAILSVVESCRWLQVPVRDYFSTILPGLPISRSAVFQTLLPLCGSPGIHRLKRPGY